MQAPSLAEFKHLYDVNAADHDGFPERVNDFDTPGFGI